jgi:hypothetical protein
MSLLRLACIASLLSACVDVEPGSAGDELTSVEGAELAIEWESFVYVPAGASDDEARRAVQRQVKSALGALRELGIGIQDRDARSNLDASGWARTRLDVVDAGGATAGAVDRVTYHYRDVALVDGEDKSWRQVLRAMRVDLPWQTGYDPMRAVNGELDNAWDGTRPLAVTVR